MFVGNVMTSRVNRDSIRERGSSLQAVEEPDFIVSDDPWFRPVDMQVAPDGSLYIADFYNKIIGHVEVPLDHPGRDKLRGRIWRVVYDGDAGKPATLDPSPNLRESDAKALIAAFDHPNLGVRMRAGDELCDRIGAVGGRPPPGVARAALADGPGPCPLGPLPPRRRPSRGGPGRLDRRRPPPPRPRDAAPRRDDDVGRGRPLGRPARPRRRRADGPPLRGRGPGPTPAGRGCRRPGEALARDARDRRPPPPHDQDRPAGNHPGPRHPHGVVGPQAVETGRRVDGGCRAGPLQPGGGGVPDRLPGPLPGVARS